VAKQSALKVRKHELKDHQVLDESKQGPKPSSVHDTRATKGQSRATALDRLIHERLRLGIISALAANESLTFVDLKNLMNTTDGNLSVHARKLEDAGYVAVTKSFDGRVPRTEYKLTAAGRRALEGYLSHMEALLEQMRGR
jgi:DNA-binding MarR family transcriptional regulator